MERKSFLALSGTLAAVVAAGCAKGKAAELELVESSGEFDRAAFAKLVDRPADVRQVWDADGYHPLILGAIKNSLNGLQFGYGIAPGRILTAVCLHGDSNAYAYDDSMWQKYDLGASLGLKDPSGAVVRTNIFAHPRSTFASMDDPNNPEGNYQDATLVALQRRGVMVFVCHNAAADQANALVQRGAAPGMTPQAVLEDLTTHIIPGAAVVPSGVATVAILQSRYRYAYTTVND
jgi:intracellular sulfur oxidation DsrE/DsrF family protein